MKSINERQAAHQFDEYSERAHNGERILVTRDGKPWVLLSAPRCQSRLSGPTATWSGRISPPGWRRTTPSQWPARLPLNFSPRTGKTAFDGVLRERIPVQTLSAGRQHACRASDGRELGMMEFGFDDFITADRQQH